MFQFKCCTRLTNAVFTNHVLSARARLLLWLGLIALLPEAVHSDHNEYRLLRHLMANYDSNARKRLFNPVEHLLKEITDDVQSSIPIGMDVYRSCREFDQGPSSSFWHVTSSSHWRGKIKSNQKNKTNASSWFSEQSDNCVLPYRTNVIKYWRPIVG